MVFLSPYNCNRRNDVVKIFICRVILWSVWDILSVTYQCLVICGIYFHQTVHWASRCLVFQLVKRLFIHHVMFKCSIDRQVCLLSRKLIQAVVLWTCFREFVGLCLAGAQASLNLFAVFRHHPVKRLATASDLDTRCSSNCYSSLILPLDFTSSEVLIDLLNAAVWGRGQTNRKESN